jgi:RNA polymerase sigma-54 factor
LGEIFVNLGYDISQRLQQKQLPQMILYTELLPLNTLELREALRAEQEQNPFLEEAMDIDAEERLEEEAAAERERLEEKFELERGDGEEPIEKLDGEEGIDWEEYLSDEGLNPGYSGNREIDPNVEYYEPVLVYEDTLDEHLKKQLSEKRLNKRLRLLVEFLIDCLDEDGYLSMPLSEAAEAARATGYEMEEALNALWTLDPAGVGARDPRECMILQLRARGMQESLAMSIVANCWELLKKRRIPEIARQLGVEPRDIQEAIDGVLKTLSLKPGGQYSGASSMIIPDLFVRKAGGRFVAELNDSSIPSLYLANSSYAKLIRRGSKANNEAKDYVRRKFDRAKCLIDAIKSRKATMLKVMEVIIEHQKDFFESGNEEDIRPLKMIDVADMIDMDKSTVSRVADSKYVQTDHGTFKLRSFFTGAVGQGSSEENGGSDITAERVRNRIRQIIDEEDPKQPVSDQKIAEILEKENLPAARRTVAKYREQMKILAARMRQKYD